MDLSVKKKCNLSIYVLIYLVFILGVILSDYVHYITHVDYNVILCISSIIMVTFTVLYIKKAGFVKTKYNILDFFFIILLFIMCIWRGIMPENSFDTSNYHLYFQGELGRDFINNDFFAVRAVNAQTLALGDRMFGAFRRVLGYRMGTMLNTFVVMIIYLQLKKVIVLFCRSIRFEAHDFVVSVIAIVCLQSENIYSILATYMIDLLSVPIVLQILLMVWDIKKEEDYVKGEALWLCIMAGILASIKISNLFMVMPLAILYLYKRWGKLHIKVIVSGVVGAVLMFALYAYISFDLTGNPLFPYMNGVFQSEWFTTEYSPNDLSAFNSRFGPKGVLETLFWPLYMVLSPEKTSDIPFCSGRLLIISVSFIVFGIVKVVTAIKEKNKQYLELIGITVLYYLMFILLLGGYMRYILVLDLLGGVIALGLIVESIRSKKLLNGLLASGLCVLFCMQMYNAGHKYVKENWEWSWRNIFDVARVKANAKMIFKDYDSGVDRTILDDIQTLLVVDHSGSLSYLLKPEANIINLISANTNETTTNVLWQRLAEMPEDGIYCLEKTGNISVDSFVNHGLKVSEVLSIQPDFCDSVYTMPFIKLEKSTEIRSIECQQGNEVLEFEVTQDDSRLELFVGNNPGGGKYNDAAYEVTVSLLDEDTGNTEIISVESVDRIGGYEKLEIMIDQKLGWDKIIVTKDNSDSSISYVHCAAVLQRYQ